MPTSIAHRALLTVALALAGCNVLTGVSSLETAAPDDGGVDGAATGDGGVDSTRPTYPYQDSSVDDDAALDEPDATLAFEAGVDAGVKRVFVTSTATQANLGGLAGGDAYCSARAAAAGLGGTWRAWLSTNTVNAITRVTASGPWYLTSGVLAVTRAQLTSAPLTRRLDRDELNNLAQGVDVWTGTGGSGTFYDDDCADWTTNSPGVHAAIGSTKNNNNSWTASQPGACNETHRLYCFEQ